jgi:5-formyltetrahydrofolate cyclo-ligase
MAANPLVDPVRGLTNTCAMLSEKKEIRRRVNALVAALGVVERRNKSSAIMMRLAALEEFLRAETILFFDADETLEPATRELAATALAAGKRIAYPSADLKTRTMRALAVRNFAKDLAAGRWGFFEPLAHLPEVPPAELDLILVPGRAFDKNGRRVGRGGGCYDVLLSRSDLHALAAAPAFDCQVFDQAPFEAHDRAVNLIVTETRTWRFGR